MREGRVAAIHGVVLDVEYPDGNLQELLEDLAEDLTGKRLVIYLQKPLGEGMFRPVAMDAPE